MAAPLSKIDFNTLVSILNNARIATQNNALYQVIYQLIQRANELKNSIAGTFLEINNTTGSLTNADIVTWSSQTAVLPNSRNLLAGDGIEFDDTAANERTVLARPDGLTIIFNGLGELEAIASGFVPSDGYYAAVTSGDPMSPALVFNSNGDTVVVWVPTP